jgi:hypothetical protein
LKAFVLERGVDMERIVRAVASELESHLERSGDFSDAVLFLEVRRCIDEPKINGTAPRREIRSR